MTAEKFNQILEAIDSCRGQMLKIYETVPIDRAIFQSVIARTYKCPICKRAIFSQYEGEAAPVIDCDGLDGHRLAWVEKGRDGA